MGTWADEEFVLSFAQLLGYKNGEILKRGYPFSPKKKVDLSGLSPVAFPFAGERERESLIL